MIRRDINDEGGFAMLAAIGAFIVAALIIIVLSVTVRTMADQNSDDKTSSIARTAANEGVDAYVRALSGGLTGEQYGYRFRDAAIRAFVQDTAGGGACAGAGPSLCWMPSSSFTADAKTAPYARVDNTYIPGVDQLTVRRRRPDGAYSFWQVLALAPPRYGATWGGPGNPAVSPGAAGVIYIRGWVGDQAGRGTTKPAIVRASVRPPLFSDYEMLIETKISMAGGFQINGRVHSNGFDDSFNDYYAGQADIIDLGPSPTCTATGRVSTASGSINGGGSCTGPERIQPNNGQRISMMRSSQTTRWLLTQCGIGGTMVPVHCVGFGPNSNGIYQVRLSGSTISVNGAGSASWSAANTRGAWGSTGQAGAVVIVPGTVSLRGALNPGTRATIIATSEGSENTYGDSASILLEQSTNFLGSPAGNSSVGLIASGDIQAIQGSACPARIRGAMVAIGGMLSMDPDYRYLGNLIGPGRWCNSQIRVEGSIAGHYGPTLQSGGNQGYRQREVVYEPDLYDNPPPLFPRTGAWEVQDRGDADLACFNETTVQLQPTRAACVS